MTVNGLEIVRFKKLESLRVDARERVARKLNIGLIRPIGPIFKVTSSDPQSPGPDQTGSPSGDQSAVEPPGPIPNPEVKRRSANGSETIGLVRVGRRQVYARLQAQQVLGAGLFFCQNSWCADLRNNCCDLKSGRMAVSKINLRALDNALPLAPHLPEQPRGHKAHPWRPHS